MKGGEWILAIQNSSIDLSTGFINLTKISIVSTLSLDSQRQVQQTLMENSRNTILLLKLIPQESILLRSRLSFRGYWEIYGYQSDIKSLFLFLCNEYSSKQSASLGMIYSETSTRLIVLSTCSVISKNDETVFLTYLSQFPKSETPIFVRFQGFGNTMCVHKLQKAMIKGRKEVRNSRCEPKPNYIAYRHQTSVIPVSRMSMNSSTFHNNNLPDTHRISQTNRSKQLVEMSKTQDGSRCVQEILETITTDELEIIMNDISPSLVSLMMHEYAHYAVQIAFKHCKRVQRTQILDIISPRFKKIAYNKQGSFSLQTLMETLHDKREIDIVAALISENFFDLLIDTFAHYCIQKFIQTFPSYCREVIKLCSENIAMISTTLNGVKVIKDILQTCTQEQCQEMIDVILKKQNVLIENQYGNYVIQEAISKASEDDLGALIKDILPHITRFSMQKFSSNVVESCLEYCPDNLKSEIVNTLFRNSEFLIRDRFGNFVLQKALKHAHPCQYDYIHEKVNPCIEVLKDKIQTKWRNLLSMYSNNSLV